MATRVKLLGICASPRRGNSQFLLNEALKVVPELGIEVEVKTYFLRGKKIGPCAGCLLCYKNGGQCVFKDHFEELRQLWIESDAVIYTLPVYDLGIPGQLKCFLDRLHNSFHGLYHNPRSMRHLKAIGAIVQGAAMYGGQDLAAQAILMHAALINSVPVAPDGSFIAACGWTAKRPDIRALKEKAEMADPDVLMSVEIAQNLVRRIVETAAIIKVGVLGLQDVLGTDPRYGPYLARVKTEGAPQEDETAEAPGAMAAADGLRPTRVTG